MILHNVRSIHNVGSMFRTADAAGVEKMYLCGITPTPLDCFGKYRKDLAKVSLGAEKWVKWEKVKRIAAVIETLKKSGYEIYALEQAKSSIRYDKVRVEKGKKAGLIVGNEVRGVSKVILGKCEKVLEIPMKGKKESLNVSVAFGIVVFHLVNDACFDKK